MVKDRLNLICPYCQLPIRGGEELACNDCQGLHHESCWQQNGGCFHPGCKNAADAALAATSEEVESRLNHLVKEWLDLPAVSAEQETAEAFYWEQVFPLTCTLFIQKEAPKLSAMPIDGLIMTVGTSPEPLILSLSACRPERVFFLHTAQTEKYLDEIVEKTGLKPSQFDKYLIRETDPLDIYQKVFDTWDKWERSKNLAVDITGGTKSMAGALAMAGAPLALPLIYVAAGEFVPERRKPKPGTEYLELLPNPYQVFGVLKEREAAELFRRMDFQGACKAYEELAQNVPEPQAFLVLASLTRAYQCWDALDFSPASQSLRKAGELINKYRFTDRWPSAVGTLAEQVSSLEQLCGKMPSKPGDSTLSLLEDIETLETLLFTVYHCSLRRAVQGKWDTAALLLYRLLEIMAQRRLAVKGLDTAEPDYSFLTSSSQNDLLIRFNEIRSNLKLATLQDLPSPIGLMEGYMLLEVLEDPFCISKTSQTGKEIHWRKFLNETQKRNYSILAHGFVFVSESQHENFKAMADQLLELFCQVEGLELARGLERYAFVMPGL